MNGSILKGVEHRPKRQVFQKYEPDFQKQTNALAEMLTFASSVASYYLVR
jgi:hypothetical protein